MQHESTKRVACGRDVLMLLGAGGCGKTTLTRAFHVETELSQSALAYVKEAVERWSAMQLRTWLLELLLHAMKCFVGCVSVDCHTVLLADDPIGKLKEHVGLHERFRSLREVLESDAWQSLPNGAQWLRGVKLIACFESNFSDVAAQVEATRTLLMISESGSYSDVLRSFVEPICNILGVSVCDDASRYLPLTYLPHVRTVGIEDSPWHSYALWDFAGQADYYPAHSLFMSEIVAVHLVMCDIRLEKTKREKQLRQWLSFIASMVPHAYQDEAKRLNVPAVTVVIAFSHIDVSDLSDQSVQNAQADAERIASMYPSLGVAGVFVLDYRDASTIEAIKECLKLQTSLSQHRALIDPTVTDVGLVAKYARQSSTPGVIDIVRLRFESTAFLENALDLVAELALKHSPPMMSLIDLFNELKSALHHHRDDNIDESLLYPLIGAIVSSLAGVGAIRVFSDDDARVTDLSSLLTQKDFENKHVVLQPIRWLAAKLGALVDPHVDVKPADGIVTLDVLDKRGFSHEESKVLLRLLVAEELGCWKSNKQKAVIVPLLMPVRLRRDNFASSLDVVATEFRFCVGRRFYIESGDLSPDSPPDPLPPGFFNSLQVALMKRCTADKRVKSMVGLTVVLLDDVYVVVRDGGVWFDILALSRPDDETAALRTLRVACAEAGLCWQPFSGCKLQKKTVCVRCCLKYDMECEANNSVVETVETSKNDERGRTFSVFGIDVPDSAVYVHSRFDETDVLRVLCGRKKSGDERVVITERVDGEVYCGTEQMIFKQLLLGCMLPASPPSTASTSNTHYNFHGDVKNTVLGDVTAGRNVDIGDVRESSNKSRKRHKRRKKSK